MKVTLQEDLKSPTGIEFEREAEYRFPLNGEWVLPESGTGRPYHSIAICMCMIVLTPKKKTYWRLDPVATFKEAFQFPLSHAYTRLSINGLDQLHYRFEEGLDQDPSIRWLKLTEVQE